MSEPKIKEEKVFSKFIVVLIILLNILFTAVILLIHLYLQVVPSDTIIIAWFGFTTGELGLLTFIRKKEEDVRMIEMGKLGHNTNQNFNFDTLEDKKPVGKKG